MAFGNALFIVLNEGLDLGISREAYWWIFLTILAFLGVEGALDWKKQ